MKVQDVMQRNVTTIAEDDSLGLARQLMLWNGVRHLPVLRPADGRASGVISERDILRAHEGARDQGVMGRPVRDFMVHPPEHVSPKADVADAAADLSAKKLGCLLVIDASVLVGIVTVGDVLGVVAQYPADHQQARARGGEHGEDTVGTIMSGEPVVAHGDDALMLAVARMARAGVRHLCVVDGDGFLIGIVSDRDVRGAIGDPRRALAVQRLPERVAHLQVRQVMTPQPRTLRRTDPIAQALDALLTDRFGALPVVDAAGRLEGIVSYIDLLKYLGERVR